MLFAILASIFNLKTLHVFVFLVMRSKMVHVSTFVETDSFLLHNVMMEMLLMEMGVRASANLSFFSNVPTKTLNLRSVAIMD